MTNRKKLKEAKAEWYLKLKQTGFIDIEDNHQRLKQYNRRTQAFDNRDRIRDYYLTIDAFLVTTTNLKPLHRQILELYTAGIYITEIAKRVNRSRARVKQILAVYRELFRASHFAQE